MGIILRFLVSIFPDFILFKTARLYCNKNNCSLSFSQEGEDMILKDIFDEIFPETHLGKKGFYVDIGAHHPTKKSNTHYFYLKGWNGINVDPNPNSISLFNKIRKNDLNLGYAISNKIGNICYFMFDEPLINTCDNEAAEAIINSKNSNLVDKIDIKTIPLRILFDKYLPQNKEIDLLSIDAEGLDFEILISNDWEKYSPLVIAVENINNNLVNTINTPIFEYLSTLNYKLVAYTKRTMILVDKKLLKK